MTQVAILVVPKLGVVTGVLLSKMKVTIRADSATLTLKLGYTDTGVFWGFDTHVAMMGRSIRPSCNWVVHQK